MPSTTQRTPSRDPTPTALTRRGPQKAHIPFRADDLERGKKTGIAVSYVDHKSDEFEPFSEIMMQADGKTPVRRGGARHQGRKSVHMAEMSEEEEGDDDGEMSMELDQSAFL